MFDARADNFDNIYGAGWPSRLRFCIIGHDEAHPPVARVLRSLADAEISWSSAAQRGAISGRGGGVDFLRAAAKDAAHGEFQFATRVSGVERRAAQARDSRNGAADRPDVRGVFAISEIQATRN